MFKKLLGACCISLGLFVASMVNVKAAAPIEQTQVTEDTRPDYALYVNTAMNVVTVKEIAEDGTEEAIKAMVASCGRTGHETPQGTFTTSDYYSWRLMVDKTYGRYAVRFNGSILFHSVPYVKRAQDTLEWDEYNKLGEAASLGCVRLSCEDAKWIYDNCKSGTKVVVYSDENNAGDLGKPEGIKIAEDSANKGWDPTDYDIKNPWLSSIIGTLEKFDAVAYADCYPDLLNTFGYDKDALYNHYITFGIQEGRIPVFGD